MTDHRPLLLWLAWLLVGAVMVLASGWTPVSRTQEARVLETAREMVDRPARDWLIPRLNGAVRLRKPPLAYWASAAAFEVFGVGDRAGRLPAVLAGWGMLGMTFVIGRRLFDVRSGFFAAATMAGTWLGFKHSMLAETDVYAAAFLTAGAYAAIRAVDAPARRDTSGLHLLAACAAGVVLSKGPTAAYLLVFLGLLAWGRGDARPLLRFVTSGAVLTLVLLAAPWFVYVARHAAEEGQLGGDLLNSAEGGDHHGPPWAYVPLLIKATLPWTAVWVAALFMAGGVLSEDLTVRRARGWWGNRMTRTGADATARAVDSSGSDPPLVEESTARAVASEFPRRSNSGPTALPDAQRASGVTALYTLAVWAASILIPLAAWGNKQFHYLLPVLPPTMILVGWAMAAAGRRRPGVRAVAIVVVITAALLCVAGPAVGVGAVRWRTHLLASDAALVGVLIALAAVVPLAWRRPGRAGGYAATTVLGFVAMFAAMAWLPPIIGGTSRRTADALRATFPDAAFAFRGTELPVLSWSMRTVIPLLGADGLAAAASDPRRVLLDQQQDNEAEPTPPAGFMEVRRYRQADNRLHVYVPITSPWAGPCVDVDG